MFDNITDMKVDFYCDNRLAAIEDLDFVLTRLKEMKEQHDLTFPPHLYPNDSTAASLTDLIERFEDE
jgi:hypothetical protein